ncbi:hypothetical protein [Allonocardiopsis opalescens]|uniref:Uncharacterized protein n=1 Tax=Allonocardiopsis opalescens TaxID=1144618 RepID=A0A2T0PP65_9ACTN|nr:hypothetical protein [Allonocardiopsis opalescens]PRX90684.1 hypothetical protein CLV72_11822 [Allonocardiopsis opalescens]
MDASLLWLIGPELAALTIAGAVIAAVTIRRLIHGPRPTTCNCERHRRQP